MAVPSRVDNMCLYTNANFIAHRGLQRHFPENSILGIEAVNIEVDVQLSRDGIALLYHDYDLQRISAQKGSVSDFDAEQLQEFSAHEPLRFSDKFQSCKLPLLHDLIAVIKKHPAVHFYIEVKEDAINAHGHDYCLRHLGQILQPVLAQVSLISFDEQIVKQAKSSGLFPKTGIVLRDWASRETVIEATAADIAYINLTRIPSSEAIQASCPIAVYEIADAALARSTLQRGAAKIETFAIDKLLQELCLNP